MPLPDNQSPSPAKSMEFLFSCPEPERECRPCGAGVGSWPSALLLSCLCWSWAPPSVQATPQPREPSPIPGASHSSLPGGVHTSAIFEPKAALDPVDQGCLFPLAEEATVHKHWQPELLPLGGLANTEGLFKMFWLWWWPSDATLVLTIRVAHSMERPKAVCYLIAA